jgi:transcriptional regulator with XRE-family HTH domain
MDRVRQLLSANMKLARTRMGYSQQKLAEAVGVSTSYIGEIEIARKFPSSGMLVRIADALGLEPHRLFYDPKDVDTPLAQVVLGEFREELLGAIGDDVDRLLRRYVRGRSAAEERRVAEPKAPAPRAPKRRS